MTKLTEQILALQPTDRVELHWKVDKASYWATSSLPVQELQEIVREWQESKINYGKSSTSILTKD